jgi:DNA-binding winged helix-turn-helix (wHTH) protein/TolB-like protein
METKVLFEFGQFRFDPAEHLLLRDGKPVSLTPKAFEILQILLMSSGRLLSKEELMSRIWPNSFVEEANLTVNISALRKALGDRPDGGDYIETVPKHGYRFVAEVTELLEEAEAASRPQVRIVVQPREEREESETGVARPLPPSPASAASSSRRVLVGTLFAAAAIAILGLFLYRQHTARQLPATSRRLAILPFQNLRHDPDSDFLGYSLADAVITKLGYVQSLRVRPSYAIAKYRNQNIEIAQVAADLKVDTLLTGAFIRDGDDLRITCQLVDATSDNILWNGAFDLKYDKLLTVHDQVAQEIVKGLELNLSPSEAERLKPDKPVDAAAYEYYLRGVDLYSRNDFSTAVKMLEKSAELDPNHALTWAYLGRSYNASASFEFGGQEHYRKARAAFDRALALQPTQPEANVYTANWLTDTGRVEEAVPLLRKALLTNPSHAEVHWELGYAYRFAGMLQESVAECEKARELDPVVKLNSSALNSYLYLGAYERFLQSLPRTNETAFIVFYRAFGEYHTKKLDQAARDFDRAYELDASLLQAQVGKALSYAIANQNPKGLEILHATEEKIQERGVRDSEAIYKIAQAYSVLGDRVSALRVFRSSIENGFFAYPYFTNDPLLAGIRQEPQFAGLMRRAQQRHEQFKRKFF